MSYFVSPTGDFQASGNAKPKTREFDVKYRLVSTETLSSANAWGIAWDKIRLNYTYFRGCKLASVAIETKAESYGRMFDVTAHYSYASEDDPMTATLSFSMRGGREKKIHSYATTGYLAQGETMTAPPDFEHAIGYDNGIFQGVDVIVPTNGFSVDVNLPNDLFNNTNLAWCYAITGSTNAAPLWGFAQGELLFLGPTGNTYRKENNLGGKDLWWKLSFEFEAQPTLTNANIPPFQGVTKQGHQYLWIFHRDKKDDTSKITVSAPVAAYVETVYPYADFSWFANLHW